MQSSGSAAPLLNDDPDSAVNESRGTTLAIRCFAAREKQLLWI